MGKKLGRGLRSLIEDIQPVRVDVVGRAGKQTLTSDAPGSGRGERVESKVVAATEDHNVIIGNPGAGHVGAGARAVEGGEGRVVEGAELRFVAVGELWPSPYQARRRFDEGELAGLAASIRVSGVMQPLLAREVAEGGGRGGGGEALLELVAGERRWRAAKLAGVERVPVIVRPLTDAQAAEVGLLENVQRADLTAMERGRGFRMLSERFALTHAEIADRMGVDRSSVTNFIRLTELEGEIADLVDDGRLGLGHARALAGMSGGPRRVELAVRAAKEGWSARRLERTIKGLPTGRSEPGASVADLEKRLGEHLGTKVRIRERGGKGVVTLAFYSLDHFDDLMRRVGYRE